jgi:hypothetical protein
VLGRDAEWDAAAFAVSELGVASVFAELRRHAAFLDKNHAERDAVKRQYRVAVASADSPDEARAFAEAPLSSQRLVFGLRDPDPAVLPAANLDEYNAEYGGHESDFLVAARQHGLDNKLVGELRDAGIRMAIEGEGRPVSDEVWSAMEKKFGSRLTDKQFTALKTWWKPKVEGQ